MLAGLVCASLTKDRYGVVRRDIPHILEAFLSFSFSTALEGYHVDVPELYVPPTPDEITQGDLKVLREKERTRVAVAEATEAIGIVADGTLFLRCIVRIADASSFLALSVEVGRCGYRADTWREACRVQVPT